MFEELPPKDYDPELHNHMSVLSDICEWLDEQLKMSFIYTQEHLILPVDVYLDLVTFLEELPATLAWIDHVMRAPNEPHDVFVIELYEQGIEASTSLRNQQGKITVQTQSLENEVSGEVPLCELNALLTTLLLQFVMYAQLGCRSRLSSPVFTDWRTHPAIARRIHGRPL
jgi:hypothetical protein